MLQLREARVTDAEALDEMVRELAAHEGSSADVQVVVEGWRELLARPDVTVLLATQSDEPIGFASTVRRLHLWSGRELLALDDLYVRAGHRDAGVGGRLMAGVARIAARDDLLVVWGVRLDNHAGQRFYARLGATLHTKMSASWTPENYRRHLNSQAF
jgi:GNAT superfamily N-acetyltransferase